MSEDQLKDDGNPIDATPSTPGENLGTDITAGSVPPSEEAPVTVPTTAPVIPPQIRETFLQKLEDDVEAAWRWLEEEADKL